MALTALMMLKSARRITAGARVASFGYPDIIASPERVAAILTDKLPHLKYRADASGICQRHGIAPRRIPDAHSFFALLGAELDVYDIERERGCEIRCDLNKPMDVVRPYDIVLDVGTLEHCFNIAQAALNMADMVAESGAIFHENPFCQLNHGFYGLNPTWYADFYGANGFDLLDCRLLLRNGKHAPLEGDARTGRVIWEHGEANLYAMAVRREVMALRFPTQHKYLRSLEEAA